MIQPLLPAVTNQTFSFGSNKTSVSIKLTQNGTAPLGFQGSTYTLTSYTFSARYSARNYTGSASGTLLTFPSGLIYSVREDFNGTSNLLITLTATSLPLTAGAASPAAQGSSIRGGAGGAILTLTPRPGGEIRRRKKPKVGNKAEYWGD